jgi:hypothetical protein
MRSFVLIAAGDYCTQCGVACLAADSVLVKNLFGNRSDVARAKPNGVFSGSKFPGAPEGEAKRIDSRVGVGHAEIRVVGEIGSGEQ